MSKDNPATSATRISRLQITESDDRSYYIAADALYEGNTTVSGQITHNTTTIQNALNDAFANHKNLKLPAGRFKLNAVSVDKSDGNGRCRIEGAGRGDVSDITDGVYPGTWLDFQNTAGDSFTVGDGTSGLKQVHFRDMTIEGRTSGTVFQWNYTPNCSAKRIFVVQKSTGNGFIVNDTWLSSFEDIECYGNGTVGTASAAPVPGGNKGFQIENIAQGGGGNIYVKNVTGTLFDLGVVFGNPVYSGSATKGMYTCHVINAQGHHCNRGVVFGYGLNTSTVYETYTEYNANIGAQFTGVVSSVRAIGGFCYNPMATDADLYLGSLVADASNTQTRRIKILDWEFNGVNNIGIYRDVAEDSEYCIVEDPVFKSKSAGNGIAIFLNSESQKGFEVIRPIYQNLFATNITNQVVVDKTVHAGTLGLTEQIAPYVFRRSSLGIETKSEAIAAEKVLTTSSQQIQILNPTGSDRNVVLPLETSSTNIFYIIYNRGTTVNANVVNTTNVLVRSLTPGTGAVFVVDGEVTNTWYSF